MPLDELLHPRRQEVALDGTDPLGRLGRDQIDSEHAAVGPGPVDGDLGPATRGVAQIDDDLPFALGEEMVFGVDLEKLEGGSALEALQAG